MPLGTPALATPVVGASATSATTASFTPTAGALLLAFGGSRQSAGAIPVISDSLGGTWNAVNNSGLEFGNVNGCLFYQFASGSPSAMTVTATSTGAGQTFIAVVQITGASTDFSNYQEDTDTAGDPSLTLASYASGSAAIGFVVGNAGGSGYTQPSGFTELQDNAPATNLRCNIAYDSSSPGTTLAWTGVSTDTIAFGVEIKEAGGNITGSKFNNTSTFGTAVLTRGAVGITGVKFNNATVFGDNNISQGAVGQDITGVHFTDADSFGTAVVGRGAVNITGSKVNNVTTFGTAGITQPGGIAASRVVNVNTFHTAVLTVGAVGIEGSLFTNTSTFGEAVVGGAAVDIVPDFIPSTTTFGSATVVLSREVINAVHFGNQNIFYNAVVRDRSLRYGRFQAQQYLGLSQFSFAVLLARAEFPQALLADPTMWYRWQLDQFVAEYPNYATTLARPERWPGS